MLNSVADSIAGAISGVDDWGLSGRRDSQYAADLVADEVALRMLRAAGVGVLSEESGIERPDAAVMVVVDPLDGSTNASRGVPWYATSLCAVDDDGPVAAVVLNLASGVRYEAVRGGGARRNGVPLAAGGSGCSSLAAAIVACSGLAPHHPGWAQFRAFGAAALDLSAVAQGMVDGFADCSADAHGVWDYLGGWLVCREVGIDVVDAFGREMVVLDHAARRTPVAAATPALLDELLVARRTW